jgi:hypothetical protein
MVVILILSHTWLGAVAGSMGAAGNL